MLLCRCWCLARWFYHQESSKFKGVVPQPNGRWGAQIYEKHQRVWLGTFNEEEEAASSYDIAARRFRGRDAVTNFKSVAIDRNDASESAFLDAHSKSEIVNMFRKHTYADEFRQTVTPSDVGKLNRLVIPKQHVEKHFPLPAMTAEISTAINLSPSTTKGKVWRFRYSYWNSSQSYVLTKEWSRFVKEKNLRPGDLVCFERSTGPDRQFFNDWKIRSGTVQNPVQIRG
ncbi:unnamed protein product [Cochlearia groenlandica]